MDIRTTVVDALDDLCSSRSSLTRRSRALNALEKLLAELCTSEDKQSLEVFLELQNGFECNVASRLLASLAMCLPALQQLISSESQQEGQTSTSDTSSFSQHAQQSLSILQGIALIHSASKDFLGRRFSIHLLLDLLAIARHATPSDSLSASSSSNFSSLSVSAGSSALASSVLDTLLCVLVDSPVALRVFEESNGVENVVKTLKRAGLARDIRMKCLEFLYFYLLPEDGSPSPNLRSASTPGPLKISSALVSAFSRSVPSSPIHPSFPASRNGQAKTKFSGETQTHGTPTSSRAPTPTSKASVPLAMLQKDVDYVPVSPKKSQVARLGVGTPGKPRVPGSNGVATPGSQPPNPAKLLFPSFAPSTPGRKTPTPRSTIRRAEPLDVRTGIPANVFEESTNRPRSEGLRSQKPIKRMDEELAVTSRSTGPPQIKGRIRSTEEKKELLGTWLGNVDALVEGVQKAGVWGLM